MYELAEITDLIHGCEGEDDPALGPTDPESALGRLLIGELVEELREEDSPIGQLFAACPVELLAELVLRLAALGAELRARGEDQAVDAPMLAAYGAHVGGEVGVWIVEAVSVAE